MYKKYPIYASFGKILIQLIELLSIIHLASSGWVDPDTKIEDRQRVSITDGNVYDIVMSDEFNRNGRRFKDGNDPMWTALDKSDDDWTSNGRRSVQFYNSSYARTFNGSLILKTTDEDTLWRGWNPYLKKYVRMKRTFRSAMVQSWNKFCYTGGILEVDVKFPGKSHIGGLWPAVWLLGNLGRGTYEASTNKIWPWSYSQCDRQLQTAQEISGCDTTSHYSLNKGQGRGSTEIDIIEIMTGEDTKLPIVRHNVRRPYVSMTLQVAPGIPSSKHRPQSGTLPEWGFHWYENLTYGVNVSINPFFYGTYLTETKTAEPVSRSKKESYQCDALSSMMTLDKSYWETFHRFRLEWQPGPDGYVHWYIDDVFKFGVEAAGLKEMKTNIPNEPSYVIMNTAISTSWGFPDPPWGCNTYDCKVPEGRCGMYPGFCQQLPAEFMIDSIRIFQNKKDPSQYIGCNPRDYPTSKFILAHEYRYKRSTDKRALLPITRGTGHCSKAADCGEGYCGFSKRCICNKGWTGVHCLVPSYKNDFVDWDKDAHWVVMESPFVPTFLAFAGIVFLVVLLGAASAFVLFRRRNGSSSSNRGSGSTSRGSGHSW